MKSHARHAEQLGLAIVSVADLAIERQGQAGAFSYMRGDRARPVPKRRLKQIDGLALPPNWRDVRIAVAENAHIQAVGIDAAGRVQYRYHPLWEDVRNLVKGERLLQFGRALPKIRAAVEADMAGRGMRRDQVLATVVRLIDTQKMRPGHEQYARNGTRGASTLTPSNLDVKDGGQVRLNYKAKSGKKVRFSVQDSALRRRLVKLKKSNRARLFRYRDRKGAKRSVTSADINLYLRQTGGRPVSAKDFRTFAASALALRHLCEAAGRGEGGSRPVSRTMKLVAQCLRNTPTVARSSYVHPPLVEAFERGELDFSLLKGRRRDRLDRAETALMRFLERA